MLCNGEMGFKKSWLPRGGLQAQDGVLPGENSRVVSAGCEMEVPGSH